MATLRRPRGSVFRRGPISSPSRYSRRLRWLRRRRSRSSGVSPIVEIRTGPGTGVASRKRQLRRRTQKHVAVRKVDTTSSWRYKVFFHCLDGHGQELSQHHQSIHDWMRTSLSGSWKVVKITPRWSHRKHKLINYVYLSDESDLFALMLCHREQVRKIFDMS